jgi:hypothetical protein
MAEQKRDAWAGLWGGSWGNAWGTRTIVEPPVEPPEPTERVNVNREQERAIQRDAFLIFQL